MNIIATHYENVNVYKQKRAGNSRDVRIIHYNRRILSTSRKKEVNIMNCNANKAIECTVKQCAHHCNEANFCSLDKILVGTHENNPKMDQCTDCMSFKKK